MPIFLAFLAGVMVDTIAHRIADGTATTWTYLGIPIAVVIVGAAVGGWVQKRPGTIY